MLASLEAAKLSSTDGLVRLFAHEVRSLKLSQVVNNKPTDQDHVIDVIHRPVEEGNPQGLPENPAHSQIEAMPALSGSRFNKLKEMLARCATKHGWISVPTTSPPAQIP
jgi:hypothetical protein